MTVVGTFQPLVWKTKLEVTKSMTALYLPCGDASVGRTIHQELLCPLFKCLSSSRIFCAVSSFDQKFHHCPETPFLKEIWS